MILFLLIFSQYFGQNKIQYRDFDFSIMDTEHFEIYFYPGEEPLADFAKEVLEKAYAEYAELLHTEIDFKIPVILYASPNEFVQTNITLELIEESVGGFTEIFKNRMVVPFTGSYQEFWHVLRHELVHVFQFQIFFKSRVSSLLSTEILSSIPLWVLEGMAEYLSVGWDIETDIYLKDLVTSEKLIGLSELGNYGGYLIYKEGQSFYRFIDQKYGREAIAKFIHKLKIKRSLDETSKGTFNIPFRQLEKGWHDDLKLKYWPGIEKKFAIEGFARKVLDHGKDRSHYNTSTSISPDGNYIAYLSDRGEQSHLIIISTIDGIQVKVLVSGERSSYFESLHLLRAGISWSPDSRLIALAAKAKGKDVIYVFDVETSKIKKTIHTELQGVYSPTWSLDAKNIAFTGLDDGYSDLYTVNIESAQIKRITNDIYHDHDPVYTDEGLVFVSDRPDSGDYFFGSYALFIHNDSFPRLTPRSSHIANPSYDFVNHGLFFIADYDSAYHLYYYDFKKDVITKKFEGFTGIYFPSISADGRFLAFCYLDGYGFDVYVAKNPSTKMASVESLAQFEEKTSYNFEGIDYDQTDPYRLRLTFDYIYGSVSYANIEGLSGMTTFVISDILGNHRIYIGTDFTGSINFSDFNINYWYLAKRIDYGLAAFQYVNYYRYSNDLIRERDRGLALAISYPFNRFFRSDLYLVKIFTDENWFREFFPTYTYYDSDKYKYSVFYPDISLIYDDSQWGYFSPISGTRTRLEVYATAPFFSDKKFQTGFLDFRRYFKLGPRTSLAFRSTLLRSQGEDREYYSLGGPGTLRGYDSYEFTSDQFILNSLELRVPFLDHLKISFPLTLDFQNIGGVLFVDNAFIWQDGKINTHHFEQGWPVLDDAKLDFGFGFRIRLLSFNLGLDFGWATDLNSVGPLNINFALDPDF